MNLKPLKERTTKLELEAISNDPRAAQRVHDLILSLGFPSPTPLPGENSESFLTRVPTESLLALVDEYDRQKRESS